METITLRINGMACGGCANTVRQALLALEGVVEADVSHETASAEVRIDPARVSVGQLQAAVHAAGYVIAE